MGSKWQKPTNKEQSRKCQKILVLIRQGFTSLTVTWPNGLTFKWTTESLVLIFRDRIWLPSELIMTTETQIWNQNSVQKFREKGWSGKKFCVFCLPSSSLQFKSLLHAVQDALTVSARLHATRQFFSQFFIRHTLKRTSLGSFWSKRCRKYFTLRDDWGSVAWFSDHMVRGHSLRPLGTLQRIYCGITSNFQTTTTEFILVALLAENRIRRIRKI